MLYNRQDSSSIVVNKSAAYIITYLNECKSISSAKDNFVAKFPNANKDELGKDFDEFLGSLETLGIDTKELCQISLVGDFDRLSIVEAELELLQKCEFACRYCVVNGSPLGNEGLSKEDWLKIAQWLLKNNLRVCTLSGGDPLLSAAFWPLVETLTANGVSISVNTTGALIDEAFINKISRLRNKHKVSFQISIDNANEKQNDFYRGETHSRPR